MIAAINARKSTEQTGVADDARSVTRQIVPCESLRTHERLDRASRDGTECHTDAGSEYASAFPITERDYEEWPG